jgi:O-antigen ligase
VPLTTDLDVAAKIFKFLAWLTLAAGLVMPTIIPEIANVSILVLSAAGLILLLVDPGARAVLRQPAAWLPLLAGAILVLALAFTAQSAMHIVAVLILAPLFLVAPLAALLVRLGRRFDPETIGYFALAGSFGAAAIAIYDVFVRGLGRGGDMFNNVIHFADLALTIGFVAAVGVFSAKHPQRLLFLVGPILALVAVMLANSRGPILAAIPVSLVSVVMISAHLLPRRWIAPVSLLAVLGLIGAGFAAYALGFGDRLARLANVGTLFATGATEDNSVNERFHMLVSAYNAFIASPIFGHGLVEYTRAAAQFAPEGPVQYAPSGHLHNDVADFAVIGGSLGLLSYILFLVAPLAGALSVAGRWRGAAIYLGVLMPVGYFAMGLTNAMLGILTQTVVYAVVLALIAALGQLKTPAETVGL